MVPPALAVAPEMTAASCTAVPTGTVRVEPPAAVLGVGVASSDRVVATLGWFCTTRVSLQRPEEHTSELQSRPPAVCRHVPEEEKMRAAESGARWLVTALGAGAW